MSGNLSGGGGVDTLRYDLASDVTVNLQTPRTATSVGTFTSIEQLVFGEGRDTLIGPSANSSWSLTGNQAARISGVTFQNVEQLVGGTGTDTSRGRISKACGTSRAPMPAAYWE